MEAPSSPSSIITAPLDYHETALMFTEIATEAMTCQFALLHYDSISKSMIKWCWWDTIRLSYDFWMLTYLQKCRPGDEGKKVPLSHFKKYHNEHNFWYPCCLCASSGRRQYTEVAVYLWRDKVTNKTSWNVRCTSDRCGYWGQHSLFLIRLKIQHHLVKIDTYYHQLSLATFNYPVRGTSLLCFRFQRHSFIDGLSRRAQKTVSYSTWMDLEGTGKIDDEAWLLHWWWHYRNRVPCSI
jgi:hypothetical protein